MTCRRCGGVAAETQEYCLDCGLRLPVSGRFGDVPPRDRRLLGPLVVTFVAVVAGASAAIVLTHDSGAAPPPVVLTGGSVQAAAPTQKASFPSWPAGTDAWTIVLASIPTTQGRATARSLAQEARSRNLPRVGILDSGRYASLHPGYWLVFTGVYETQPEATGALQQARAVSKTARVQRVA